jgi:hypothetical protein
MELNNSLATRGMGLMFNGTSKHDWEAQSFGYSVREDGNPSRSSTSGSLG